MLSVNDTVDDGTCSSYTRQTSNGSRNTITDGRGGTVTPYLESVIKSKLRAGIKVRVRVRFFFYETNANYRLMIMIVD